jgi:hypothetical protein
MRKLHSLLAIVLLLSAQPLLAQTSTIDSSTFFVDQAPIEMTLTSDFKTLLMKRDDKKYQPANITLRFADSSMVQEEIRIQTRGKFRLANCYMPPLLLNFKNPGSPKLKKLGKLKLVCGCATGNDDEQLIVKEYIAYRIYNILTEKSFRTRLVKIKYDDTRGKVKSYTQFGFLLEDVDDMAERNKCVEVEKLRFLTESTNRLQMTLVSMFEFMIGNTDWSVPVYHNIKLIRHAEDSLSMPYSVPYDFNHCGLVNAPYAAPQEDLGISTVRERVYRGFPRRMEELEQVIAIFMKHKDEVFGLINNCQWLNNRNKREMVSYIAEFYDIIQNKNVVKFTFIENARTQ